MMKRMNARHLVVYSRVRTSLPATVTCRIHNIKDSSSEKKSHVQEYSCIPSLYPTYIKDVTSREKLGCLGNILLSGHFCTNSILTVKNVDINAVFLTNIRLFSSRKKSTGKRVKSYEEVLNYDSSDDGNEEEYFDDDYDPLDNDGKSKTWKDIRYHISGFRADQILATGLGLSRNKVDDAFLSGKLRLNGEKLTKKSKRIDVGDTVDIVKGSEEDKIEVMRVVFRKLEDEKSRKDKYIVILRRWKHLVLPKPN
ncbi:uncharacterized protein LOC102803715 [Saccoglossus kowalevskii]|uniref:Uncharacterized protein C6orf203-like n=1 Tax=Saccoglossus kowalevskii TaxID=10224 RepID=A0ABM0M0W7_SACKO|nr:PREDICTED: uncharacterized protein C6orf203-like [Saccoglossus kowalevskii]